MFEIIFNESTALYFYSALLQANAAIIALIGLYTTFRIQSASAIIDSCRNYFFAGNDNLREYGTRFYQKSMEERKKQIDGLPDGNSEKFTCQKWYDNLIWIEKLKSGIIIPTILLGIALISNALSLFSSSNLERYYPNGKIYLAYFNLSYEIILIFIISLKVISLMRSEI